MTTTLTGLDAITYAVRTGATLHRHADPVDGDREVTPDEARAIAREDAGLIWCEATTPRHTQWTDSSGASHAATLTPDEAAALAVSLGRRVTQYDDGQRPVLTCEPDGRRMGHSR